VVLSVEVVTDVDEDVDEAAVASLVVPGSGASVVGMAAVVVVPVVDELPSPAVEVAETRPAEESPHAGATRASAWPRSINRVVERIAYRWRAAYHGAGRMRAQS
jgi:hypothetical protein